MMWIIVHDIADASWWACELPPDRVDEFSFAKIYATREHCEAAIIGAGLRLRTKESRIA